VLLLWLLLLLLEWLSKARKAPKRLVRLTHLLVNLNDTTLNHLKVKVISLTGSLSDSSKDRVTSVVHGNVVNQLHDNDSLADSGSTKEANLSSLGVRGKEVHHLDSSDENLTLGGLVNEGGGLSVEGGVLPLAGGKDGPLLVHGLADDVQDAAEGLGTHGHLDGRSGVGAALASHEALGGLHGNAADGVLSQVLGNLQDEAGLVLGSINLQGVQDLGELSGVELDIHNGSNHLGDLSVGESCGRCMETAGGRRCDTIYIDR